MLFQMNIRLPKPYFEKFLMLCACAVDYIVLPGENGEDSAIGRIPVSEDVKDKEILFMSNGFFCSFLSSEMEVTEIVLAKVSRPHRLLTGPPTRT